MNKPQWIERLEFLSAVNSDYEIANDLLSQLYPYQLRELFEMLGNEKSINHLTSWELKIEFLERFMFSSIDLLKLKEYVDFYSNNPHSRYVVTDSDLTKHGFIFTNSCYFHCFHFSHLAHKIIVSGNSCQWSLTLVRDGKHHRYTEENRSILETPSVLTPEFELLIEEIEKKYPLQFIFDDVRKVIDLKDKLVELHNVIIPF